MRNYIILNNQRSDEISGLIIQELAPISKPLQRTQVETIDGRDGDIVTPLGYAAYDKKITIGLYGDFDINEIIAYFATQGTAIFSNEPDKYYNYQILDQIDYERLVRFRVATVTMHVQPFKYSATEGTLTIDASDTVSGEGSEIALDNTAEAPFMTLRHKGNAIQNGTPTPDNPVDIQVATGEQTIKITGKNLAYDGWAQDFVTRINNAEWANIGQYEGRQSLMFLPRAGYGDYDNKYLFKTNFAENTQYTFSFDEYATDQFTSLAVVYTDGTTEVLFYGSTEYNKWIHVVKTTAQNKTVKYLRANWQGGAKYIDFSSFMCEKSATATDYEPYKGQEYKLNLGKNLFNSFGENSGAITVEADGSIKISGVSSANGYCSMGKTLAELAPTLKVGDTVYLYLETDWSGKSIYIAHGGYWQNGVAKTITQDMLNDTVIVYGGYQTTTTIKIMMTKTLDTDYAPYFTPIELAAIGDYADEPVKVGDTWYIRRAIGKVDLSTLVWGSGSAPLYSTTSISNIKYVSANTELGAIIATKYTNHIGSGMSTAYGCIAIDVNAVRANDTTGTPSGIAYYALATPVDEEITEQALIDQLDDIYEQAHSYKGRTHITANAQGDNAPAVLSVEVGEDNESTVTNAGNTTSRPILTIYGQGNIGVYINDVEVLDIALGNEQYITLDSTEMDAYKDSPANLKNRLVTGDYSKLALNAGANKIRFTGNVTKYEISKYSRWL